MIAGESDPLFADWQTWLREPETEWSGLWDLVASRAAALVDDFPIAAAMVKARLLRVHGPHGLRFRSLYQLDDQPDTTDAEIQKRREIELAIKRGSLDIDAGGMLSRAELDWCISWNACVLGDGFAVRVWQPIEGVKTSTRWRIIHPMRVRAPSDKQADPKYNGGIELDNNGRPVAVWVEPDAEKTNRYAKREPVRIAWTGPDGTRNVVHKVGLRRPGSRRGLSEFAPVMLPARLLQGVDIAYVTMKRVQASHPLLIKVADVKAAREQYRGTRIGNLLIGKDHEVELPPFKFEGADYREFVDTTMRSICAAWQLPWELVLGDHSAKSGASSRSLWQQHYQMAEREQAQHVEQVQAPMDESIVREAAATGVITLGSDWQRNMSGIYQGPPKVMPDPAKEIEWATGAVALGMSKSTVFARMGEDYRDEVMQSRQDKSLSEAQEIEDDSADDEDDSGDPSVPPHTDDVATEKPSE
jgi:capsid protein